MRVFSRLSPAKSTVVFDSYWRFAAERQEIFFKRHAGLPRPWTKDAILQEYKFTNAYRASDRVSQYLIRNVIYDKKWGAADTLFRIILFKLFNRISTWELLRNSLGEIRYSDYSYVRYDSILMGALERGERIYSGAYIMPSGSKAFRVKRKHQAHLRLLEMMMNASLPQRIEDSKTMKGAFELLRSYPMIGDFLAYQYVSDLNYSELTDFSEMEFVVPGPGARDGLRKCFSDFGGLSEPDLIRLCTERQEAEFLRLKVPFRSLWGRPLQYIDCQNIFCEVDKYARVAHPDISGHSGRVRIKQRYRPTDGPLQFWYPPKWGINTTIGQGKNV